MSADVEGDLDEGTSGGFDEERKASSADEPTEEEPRSLMISAVEDHFLCPITQEVMRDPVTDKEGNTWERSAILVWIRNKRISPKTGNVLRERELVPNRVLRNFIASVMGSEYVHENSWGDQFNSSDGTYREKMNEYLAFVGDLAGQNLQLNDDGLCALEYQDLLVVVDVPSESRSFYLYSAVVNEMNPSEEAEVLKKAMLLNHLQIDTKGGSLGQDPRTGEIIFCMSDRVMEIDSPLFRNVLENFIDKAINIRTKLRPAGDANPASEAET